MMIDNGCFIFGLMSKHDDYVLSKKMDEDDEAKE